MNINALINTLKSGILRTLIVLCTLSIFSVSSAYAQAPSGLVATPGNTQVVLTWNSVSGASSYNIYRGTSTGQETTTAATGLTSTTYTDTGLTNNTVYYYVVKSVVSGVESGASNEVAVTPTATTTVTADSGVDFSSTQGTKNWYYGYYNSTADYSFNISSMSFYSSDNGWHYQNVSTYPCVWAHFELPGSAKPAVRRWKSTISGTVTISGHVAKSDTRGGDGVVCKILCNGSVIQSYPLAYNNSTGTDFNFNLDVSLNDNIDFAVFPNANNAYDSSQYTVQISAAARLKSPTNLTATAGTTQINLSWTGVTGASSYNVKRSTDSASYSVVATGVSGTTYADTSVAANIPYSYYVAAVDNKGEGTASNIASATIAQTLTSITTSPQSASLNLNHTQQFNASGKDQFGATMATQPSFTWSIDTGGVGSVDTNGLYNAGATAGTAVVLASNGSISGTSNVTVTNASPTITTHASANPNPVIGTTTNLSVLGADDGGEANLTYTWSTSGTPPAPVTFSDNGTNTAKNTTATFTKAGAYTFVVTVTDQQGLTVTDTINVTVNATPSAITVSPASVTLNTGGTQQFTASAVDQFGNAITPNPTYTWSIDIGGFGSVDTSGLYTAGSTDGSAIVRATNGSVSGTANVTVNANASGPTIVNPAAADPNPATTWTSLSVLGDDAAGENTLTYTWSFTGPGNVSFYGINGNNYSKNMFVLFSAIGQYTCTVTVTNLNNQSTTSSVIVNVNQQYNISVSPSSALLSPNTPQTFTASVRDQFNNPVNLTPTWSIDSGGVGTIDQSGNYISADYGSATVRATIDSQSGTASVSIPNMIPISCGQTVNGELTTASSPTQVYYWTYYNDYYNFTSTPGKLVIITCQPTFYGNLSVSDSSNNTIAANNLVPTDINNSGSSDYTSSNAVQFLTSDTSTFKIKVSSQTIGAYSLSVVCDDPSMHTPSHLVAHPGNNIVGLTWTSSGITGDTYDIKRLDPGDTGYHYIGSSSISDISSTGTSYVDNTVENGKTYSYIVVATLNSVELGSSNAVSATPNAPTPTAVSCSQEIHGNLQSGSTTDYINGSYRLVNYYSLSEVAGSIVTLTIHTDSLNQNLLAYLLDPFGNQLNESSPGSVTIPATGIYTVVVTNAYFGDNFDIGAYTLDIDCSDVIDISSISLYPDRVSGGNETTATVTMTQNASQLITIQLQSDNTAANVPSFVYIYPGTSSATFKIPTNYVNQETLCNITAKYGTMPKSAILTIEPASALSLSLSSDVCVGGNPATLTVSLNAPAPDGGLTFILSSDSTKVVVPDTVTIPAGKTTVNVALTTLPVATPVNFTISASGNNMSTQVFGSLIPATPFQFSVDPNMVAKGQSSTGTITLTGPAPSGGVTFALAALDPYYQTTSLVASVPASVTVPEGKASVTFPITTLTAGNAQITTTTSVYNNVFPYVQYANLTVVNAPITFTIDKNPVIGGGKSIGTITLAAPQTADLSMAVYAIDASVSVPEIVTIPAGQSQVNFPIQTSPVTSELDCNINVYCWGILYTNTLQILPPEIDNVTISPTPVAGGYNAMGTVTLISPAPSDITVGLLSGDTSIATVPDTVVVPAGQTSATFNIATQTVAQQTTVPITATSADNKVTATLVVDPMLSGITLNPSRVVGGETSYATVTLTLPAPTGGYPINLASDNDAATLAATLTIGEGKTSATIPVQTISVTNDQTANISAFADECTISTPLGIAPNLNGGFKVISGNIDLTTEGKLDWAHWGLSSSDSFDHKADIASLISNATSANATQNSNTGISYSWSDGTPTLAAANTTTGISVSGSGNCFTFSVPADTGIRTLKVYVGAQNAVGKFTAHLSDSSSPDYTNTLNASTDGVYTIAYKAASAGQTLNVSWTVDSGDGAITLEAATLCGSAQGPSGTPLPPTGLTATSGNGQVALIWNASSDAVSYNLYRSTTSGNEGAKPYVAGLTGTNYTDISVTNDTTYYYTLTAVNQIGESQPSSEVSATPTAGGILYSVSINPTSIVGGNSVSGIITLNGIASSGGVTVVLTSSNDKVASVPSIVIVPEGSNIAFFTVNTVSGMTDNITITAKYAGVTKTALLNVVSQIVNPDSPLLGCFFVSPEGIFNLWFTYLSPGYITSSVLGPQHYAALYSFNAVAGETRTFFTSKNCIYYDLCFYVPDAINDPLYLTVRDPNGRIVAIGESGIQVHILDTGTYTIEYTTVNPNISGGFLNWMECDGGNIGIYGKANPSWINASMGTKGSTQVTVYYKAPPALPQGYASSFAKTKLKASDAYGGVINGPIPYKHEINLVTGNMPSGTKGTFSQSTFLFPTLGFDDYTEHEVGSSRFTVCLCDDNTCIAPGTYLIPISYTETYYYHNTDQPDTTTTSGPTPLTSVILVVN